MVSLRELEERIVASGRVEGHELKLLLELVYADGRLGRQEADFLVAIHKRVQYRTHAFEQFFYEAIKDHILIDGRIGAEQTAWLRRMLLHDGKIDDEERGFLHRLRGEVRRSSPEFEALFQECRKLPPQRHTAV
jgi:hypothetical protein